MEPINEEKTIGLYDIIGQDEIQISENGEGDIHTDFKNCTKNPGHDLFIPVDTFTIQHLPKGHQDKDLYHFIQVVADLTVRVDVQESSPNRPEFWPGTTSPYPFYIIKGSNSWRSGSGRVSLVTKYKNGYNSEGVQHWMNSVSCGCRKCRHSDSPSSSWWEIEILTATHVIFDEVEARRTSCRLFYDNPDSPSVKIDGVGVSFVNVERDWCRLVCVTCDMSLGEMLYNMKKLCNSLWMEVHNKYQGTRETDKFMFLVSHPHGCFKHISIGQWQNRYLVHCDLFNYNKFTYTTCTCPGSSGATVYCLGFSGWWLYQIVHSGTLPSGLNYSGSSFVL